MKRRTKQCKKCTAGEDIALAANSVLSLALFLDVFTDKLYIAFYSKNHMGWGNR